MLDRLAANWPLKLLSLGLAFAIWFSVIDEDWVIDDVTVPLQLNLDASQIIASDPPREVTLRLNGPVTAIRGVDPLGLSVAVDMTEFDAGPKEIPLNMTHVVGLDPRINLEFISPDRVGVTLAARRSRTGVPVNAAFLGELPTGYHMYRNDVYPPRVGIEGPAEVVGALEFLTTNPINLAGRRDTFQTTVRVVPADPHVRVTGASELRVEVVVDQAPVSRPVDGIPVRLLGPEANQWIVEPDRVSMDLYGPPRLLDGLRAGDLVAVAETDGLDAEQPEQELPIRARFLRLTELDRAKLEVRSLSLDTVVVRRVETPADGTGAAAEPGP